MVNAFKPDERSVMTYVSAYYHAFAGAHKVMYLHLGMYVSLFVCFGLISMELTWPEVIKEDQNFNDEIFFDYYFVMNVWFIFLNFFVFLLLYLNAQLIPPRNCEKRKAWWKINYDLCVFILPCIRWSPKGFIDNIFFFY